MDTTPFLSMAFAPFIIRGRHSHKKPKAAERCNTDEPLWRLFTVETGRLAVQATGQPPAHLLGPSACLLAGGSPTTLTCNAAARWGELLFQMEHAPRHRRQNGRGWVHAGPVQPNGTTLFGQELPEILPAALVSDAVATVGIAGGLYFHDDVSHAESNALLHRFLIRLIRHVASPSAEQGPLAQAEAYAQRHIDTGCSVADMAQAVGMSAGHLTARWRAERQETPGACLDRIRLARACEKLRAGTTILLCAQACGYRSSTAFTAWFKKMTGNTPSAWRRLHVTA